MTRQSILLCPYLGVCDLCISYWLTTGVYGWEAEKNDSMYIIGHVLPAARLVVGSAARRLIFAVLSIRERSGSAWHRSSGITNSWEARCQGDLVKSFLLGRKLTELSRRSHVQALKFKVALGTHIARQLVEQLWSVFPHTSDESHEVGFSYT